ncbi:uncharacterized protein LOC115160284 [Salmo trutta]|uniref:uncharacterized protein LOC115160284 n=1 Tax=Salmo trutta TaxID=8032 RepID=UPI001131BED9|nr:uncharacterized protein LOC115160284 [Salmo trutta]
MNRLPTKDLVESPLSVPPQRPPLPPEAWALELERALSKQTDRFLHQVQTFEELLRKGKPKPFEQMEGVGGPYIPVWDALEELKEQVEQTEQDRPTSEAPPTLPPYPTPYSMPAGGSKHMPLPESFREVPRLLDLDLTEGDHDSPDAGEEATHAGGEGTREGPHPGTRREEGGGPHKSPSEDLSQSTAFHGSPANDSKRSEVRKSRGSSLTSLGERQDHLTRDVGSESSHLTPAAPSPFHQMATVR